MIRPRACFVISLMTVQVLAKHATDLCMKEVLHDMQECGCCTGGRVVSTGRVCTIPSKLPARLAGNMPGAREEALPVVQVDTCKATCNSFHCIPGASEAGSTCVGQVGAQ